MIPPYSRSHLLNKSEGRTTGVPLNGIFPQASPPKPLILDTVHKLLHCTAVLVSSRSAFTHSDTAPRLLVSHMDIFLSVPQTPA